MKKWVVCRGAFLMDRQLLDEAFLKEWYHSLSDSTAETGGEDEDSKDDDDSRLPRGNHQGDNCFVVSYHAC